MKGAQGEQDRGRGTKGEIRATIFDHVINHCRGWTKSTATAKSPLSGIHKYELLEMKTVI